VALRDIRQGINDIVAKSTTPPTGAAFAGKKAGLDSMIDEFGKLKELERHLQNTVQGAAEFAGRQQGFWKRRTITEAAQDAKNLDNVKKQIAAQSEKIAKAENEINNFATRDAAVKESLRKQSNLYRATDAIATKAKDQIGTTRTTRAAKSVKDAVNLKNGALGLLAAGGIGVSGLALPAAGAGLGALALYGGKKALTSPALRTSTGGALRKIGESL